MFQYPRGYRFGYRALFRSAPASATPYHRRAHFKHCISIHRPRCDALLPCSKYFVGSIHAPASAATPNIGGQSSRNFNPRTRECDNPRSPCLPLPVISIHAPTRSAARLPGLCISEFLISIHAPREVRPPFGGKMPIISIHAPREMRHVLQYTYP